MPDPLVVPGEVDADGVVHLDIPAAQHRAACRARFAGQRVDVEIRRRKSKRSLRQNAYWWGVVIPMLAEHCGYSGEEMHDALKAKFLGREDLERGLMRIGSTAALSAADFAALVDRVVLWAAEDLGVIIPLPNE